MRCDQMSTLREPRPWRPHGYPDAREADDRRRDVERRDAEAEARLRRAALDDRKLSGWV
jgi:hypothetical protein